MSSPVYHRTGLAWRDAFIYLNADGTFNTGRVQGDFTIKLSAAGVGNQSTTGITITEVDSTHNPGEYTVAAATTAFPATDGVYTLVITRTSDPLFTWEQVIVVNSTGTYIATPASFTASSGNGRVTDGSSGIAGATVYITLGSTFVGQLTTDANGDWGPIYLTTGTFTARAQASGYIQGSATIIVAGATVTGPGTDIALVAGSTTDLLSAAQLWAYARRQATDLTGTKADTIIKAAVNDALDMVSSQRDWPHLLRTGYLSLQTPYSTGAIDLTNADATVTLSGGTLPTWAASGRIFFNGQIMDVATRTDGTHLELAAPFGGDDATGVSYILFQNEYDLPDDLWRLHAVVPGQRWGWGGEARSPREVIEAEAAAMIGQAFPSIYCVIAGGLRMWPYPSDNATVAYTYYARPARLVNDTDVADWDPVHLEMLRRAIDYQLARQLGKVVGGDAKSCLAAFIEAMARDVPQDKQPVDIPAVGSSPPWSSRSLDWARRTS